MSILEKQPKTTSDRKDAAKTSPSDKPDSFH